MGQPLFSRKASLFIKAQASEGAPAAPGAGDGILVEVQSNPYKVTRQAATTNEVSNSLNSSPSIPGGLQVEIPGQIILRGSGLAGVAAAWDILLQAALFTSTAQAAPIPAAPEAAAAGSATTLTLGAGAAGTAELYRGLPIHLTGNPAAAVDSFISDYTAGKVATLTDSFGTPLDVTTNYQILENVAYATNSDVTDLKFYTADLYIDGQRICLTDARVRIDSFEFPTAGVPRMKFTILGIAANPIRAAGAPPATIAAATFDPPIFRGGVFTIDRKVCAIKTLTINPGMSLQQFPDPNATEGFGSAVPTERKWTFQVDPMDMPATHDTLNDFQAGGRHLIHAHFGSTAGNRLGITIPAAQYLQWNPADDQGGQRTTINGECTGLDGAEFLLTVF